MGFSFCLTSTKVPPVIQEGLSVGVCRVDSTVLLYHILGLLLFFLVFFFVLPVSF